MWVLNGEKQAATAWCWILMNTACLIAVFRRHHMQLVPAGQGHVWAMVGELITPH